MNIIKNIKRLTATVLSAAVILTNTISVLPASASSKTAAKTATTTASATVNGNDSRLAYMPHLNVKKTSMITRNKKASTDMFPVSDISTWYAFHFDDKGIVGAANTYQTFYNTGYVSLVGVIQDNRQLVVQFKDNGLSDHEYKLVNMELEGNFTTPVYETLPEKNQIRADLYDDCFVNDIYRIKCQYDDNGFSHTMYLYLFVNCASDSPEDYEFYICYCEQHYYSENFEPMARQKYVTNLIASEGATPDNTRSVPDIEYPVTNNRNSELQYWVDKSVEICKDTQSGNGLTKVFLLHEWMTSHMKYDFYKINYRNGVPRYFKDSACTIVDESMLPSRTNTGVCLDYAIIYAIMCRTQGIPCVVLSTKTHAWNAVYLDNMWVEIDITQDVNRFTYSSDLNDVTGSQLYDYRSFCNYRVNDTYPETATRFAF